MQEQEIERLAFAPLFEELSPENRKRLLEGAIMEDVAAGSTLFEQGDRAEYLYILVEGSVELRGADKQGKQTVVEIVQPVDTFILAAVITESPYLMSAYTLTDSRVARLAAEDLRRALHDEPEVALMLLATLSRHYRCMVRQIKDLKLRTSSERIGSFLLSLAREEAGSGRVELPYAKRILADRLNMTPENLSRAFAQLRERGVFVEGSRVVIDDLETLADFCRVDPLIDRVEDDLAIHDLPPQHGGGNARQQR